MMACPILYGGLSGLARFYFAANGAIIKKPVYADSFSDTSIQRFFYFLSMHTRYSLVPSSYFLIPDSMKPWA